MKQVHITYTDDTADVNVIHEDGGVTHIAQFSVEEHGHDMQDTFDALSDLAEALGATVQHIHPQDLDPDPLGE